MSLFWSFLHWKLSNINFLRTIKDSLRLEYWPLRSQKIPKEASLNGQQCLKRRFSENIFSNFFDVFWKIFGAFWSFLSGRPAKLLWTAGDKTGFRAQVMTLGPNLGTTPKCIDLMILLSSKRFHVWCSSENNSSFLKIF